MESHEGRDTVAPLRYWRNWWGLKCWLRYCGGMVDGDAKSVYWLCGDCGKVVR